MNLLGRKTLCVIFFVALIVALPLPTISAQESITLPPLTGAYTVGKIDHHFVDRSRKETFTDDPDDVRELMTTIYYPASASSSAKPAPYGNDALKSAASEWPGIAPERWSQIKTPMVSDAPFAPDQNTYPVILFSPGLATLPVFYTTLLAELASNGYVVVSIARTYTTSLVVFPDGRSIRSNAAGTDVDGHRGDTFFDAQKRRAQINDVWVADIRFVIDQLKALNQENSLLSGHLDLTRIGLMGHSFGGSAGAQAAYLDNRIGAVVSMDSWLDGEVALEGISQPYLLMEPANPDYEDPKKTPPDEQLTAMGLKRSDLDMLLLRASHLKLLEKSIAGYRVRLTGAQHNTFTTDLHVFAAYFPARINQQQTGTIDGKRVMQIIAQYNLAFFDQHLKGQKSALLNGTSADYPEVTFKIF